MNDSTSFSDAAVTAFAAWSDHCEQCTAGCWVKYGPSGMDEHNCPVAAALLGAAITANTRALHARQPVDAYADEEDPACLVGQPWVGAAR